MPQVTGYRFLDLDDHLAGFIQGSRIGLDRDANGFVIAVGKAAFDPGIVFYKDLVPGFHQISGSGRNQGHARNGKCPAF